MSHVSHVSMEHGNPVQWLCGRHLLLPVVVIALLTLFLRSIFPPSEPHGSFLSTWLQELIVLLTISLSFGQIASSQSAIEQSRSGQRVLAAIGKMSSLLAIIVWVFSPVTIFRDMYADPQGTLAYIRHRPFVMLELAILGVLVLNAWGTCAIFRVGPNTILIRDDRVLYSGEWFTLFPFQREPNDHFVWRNESLKVTLPEVNCRDGLFGFIVSTSVEIDIEAARRKGIRELPGCEFMAGIAQGIGVGFLIDAQQSNLGNVMKAASAPRHFEVHGVPVFWDGRGEFKLAPAHSRASP